MKRNRRILIFPGLVDTKKVMFIIIFGGVRMVKKRSRYTKEFKIEAVRLLVEEGRRISELSRELGVGENLLRCWKKQSEEGKIEPFPGKGLLSPEDGELRRLRRENERLRMERDI